jgi:hypothetical protein
MSLRLAFKTQMRHTRQEKEKKVVEAKRKAEWDRLARRLISSHLQESTPHTFRLQEAKRQYALAVAEAQRKAELKLKEAERQEAAEIQRRAESGEQERSLLLAYRQESYEVRVALLLLSFTSTWAEWSPAYLVVFKRKQYFRNYLNAASPYISSWRSGCRR